MTATDDERAATARTGSRVLQVALGVVLGLLSSVLLVVVHRLELTALGVDWPVGLLLCLVFQVAAVVYLWTAALRRTPLLAFLVTFLMAFSVLSAEGPLGSTLVPARIGDVVQWQSLGVILIGVGVPVVALLVLWFRHLRALTAEAAARAAAAPPSRR